VNSEAGDGGAPKPNAVPPAADRVLPSVNGKPAVDIGPALTLNRGAPHPPAAKTGTGPGPGDGHLGGGPGRGDSPGWPWRPREAAPGGRFLIWLSGARRQILAECPTERPKYTGLGVSILIPAGMAAVSLTFALVTVLRAELWVALLFAAAWAMVIVSLDRMFVVSLPRTGTWQTQLLRATPRFLLALLLGLVISTPFVLQIFRPEIAHEITLLHTQAANAYYRQLQTSPLTKQISQDEAQISQLQAELAGAVPLSQDLTLASLRNQLSQAETTTTSDYHEWQCQLSGTASSGQVCKSPGNGPLAAAALQRYQTDRAAVTQLEQQINTREKSLLASDQEAARQELPAAESALKSAQAQQSLQTSDFNTQNNSNTGLLIRLQALGQATAGNSTLDTARWLLFALFVVIDLMPVVLKVMLNLGPENEYDKMLTAEEELQQRVAAARRTARLSAEEAQIDASQRISQELLHRWEAEQLQKVSGTAAPAEYPQSTTPPSGGSA